MRIGQDAVALEGMLDEMSLNIKLISWQIPIIGS